MVRNIFNRIDRPYIIAEAGVNHNGSLEIAKKLIDTAKYWFTFHIENEKENVKSKLEKWSSAYGDL